MRHQFAWDFATETISPNTRRKEVRRIASQNAKEKRIIAARKERAKT